MFKINVYAAVHGTIGEDKLQETYINNKEIANMFRVSVKS